MGTFSISTSRARPFDRAKNKQEPVRAADGPTTSSGGSEVGLQRPHFKLAAHQRFNAERRRIRARKGREIRDLVEQRGAPERTAVGQGLRTFGGVDDQLNFAVLD